jgi:hypothetical protein
MSVIVMSYVPILHTTLQGRSSARLLHADNESLTRMVTEITGSPATSTLTAHLAQFYQLNRALLSHLDRVRPKYPLRTVPAPTIDQARIPLARVHDIPNQRRELQIRQKQPIPQKCEVSSMHLSALGKHCFRPTAKHYLTGGKGSLGTTLPPA